MSPELKKLIYSCSILLISIIALAYAGLPGLIGALGAHQTIKSGG